jgi:osmotically inducible protein OsmC
LQRSEALGGRKEGIAMAMATRVASVSWKGDLTGSGELSLESSGVLKATPVTWASRAEAPEGRTSPEELLAAAHSACYAMAFSNILAKEGGMTAESLDVRAECDLDRVDGGLKVTTMRLQVRGRVPGIDEAGFVKLATAAKEGCPVSGALMGNVAVELDAALA